MDLRKKGRDLLLLNFLSSVGTRKISSLDYQLATRCTFSTLSTSETIMLHISSDIE
jgi:hypothetical protein